MGIRDSSAQVSKGMKGREEITALSVIGVKSRGRVSSRAVAVRLGACVARPRARHRGLRATSAIPTMSFS